MYKFPEDKNSKEYDLQAPFREEELEWRIQTSGISSTGIWARALVYLDARTIQQRLDSVFTVFGWECEYRVEKGGSGKDNASGIFCRLTVKNGDEKVSKEDGSQETEIEAFKGGISGAFKRVAASGFGIGRYLYYIESSYCDVSQTEKKDWKKAKTNRGKWFYWRPKPLPKWALRVSTQKNNNPDNKVDVKVETKPDPIESSDTQQCAHCGEAVSEKVLTFTVSKYGKAICYNCQKGKGLINAK